MCRILLFSVIRTHLGEATVDKAVDLEYDINAAISSVGDAEKHHDVTGSNDQEPKELVKEKAVVTQGGLEREVKYDDIFIASADGMLLCMDRKDSIFSFDHRIEVKACLVHLCCRYY